MTKMLPCPFCGSEIKHVESWAKSFDPPRLYHEWQHVEKGNCWIANGRSIIAHCDEKPESIRHAVETWNARCSAVSAQPVGPLGRENDAFHRALSKYPASFEALHSFWNDAFGNEPQETADSIVSMREALNKVNDWLVCHSIASDEDMAQSFPTMCKIVNDALASAAVPQTASMREALEDCIAFITGQVSGTAQRDVIVKEAERALAAYSQADNVTQSAVLIHTLTDIAAKRFDVNARIEDVCDMAESAIALTRPQRTGE